MLFIEEDQPNVFEMFVAHGGPGFWVRRTTWGATCARVVRVGTLTGPPPYFGNPSVIMDVYSLQGKLKDAAAQLPVPGTFKTWRQVEAPDWASPKMLRSLDDPALDVALNKLDRKRNKLDAKPVAERTTLMVPYERKDEAKAIGAKWDAAARTWWIPADDTSARAKAVHLGFLEGQAHR
jgi:hypothetical protein